MNAVQEQECHARACTIASTWSCAISGCHENDNLSVMGASRSWCAAGAAPCTWHHHPCTLKDTTHKGVAGACQSVAVDAIRGVADRDEQAACRRTCREASQFHHLSEVCVIGLPSYFITADESILSSCASSCMQYKETPIIHAQNL